MTAGSYIDFIHPDTGEVVHTMHTRRSLVNALSSYRAAQDRQTIAEAVGLESDIGSDGLMLLGWGIAHGETRRIAPHVWENHMRLTLIGGRVEGPTRTSYVDTDTKTISVVCRVDYTPELGTKERN